MRINDVDLIKDYIKVYIPVKVSLRGHRLDLYLTSPCLWLYQDLCNLGYWKSRKQKPKILTWLGVAQMMADGPNEDVVMLIGRI